MSRRKQHIQQFSPDFHERRKRWSDRRERSRFWGIIFVPIALLKQGVCALFGIKSENR
jgi:hypothetical protein